MRILLFAVLIVFLLPVTASADGMAFEPSPESVSYSALVREERQVAVIAYEDGKETLFLSVDMLPESDSFVWLFPIPAKPDVTDLDVVKTFPKIGGKNVIVEAKRSAEKLAEYSFGSQIYPLIFLLEFRRAAWESSPKATQRAYGPDVLDLEQVVVHKSVTKYGVTTELLTTESKAPLLAYLAEKGLSLPGEAGMILDEYIGGDFSFVTVWREDVAAGEANLPAGRRGKITSNVTISFPTKKIFFPLKPTSIYGKRIIPIEFTIQGYVDPDLPKELREFQSAGYFYSHGTNFVTHRRVG